MKLFIDSNIPMYVAGREHPHREPSRRFLRRVREGKVDACSDAEYDGADFDEEVVNLSGEVAAAYRCIPIKYLLQHLGTASGFGEIPGIRRVKLS
jgi:hypothetical protein